MEAKLSVLKSFTGVGKTSGKPYTRLTIFADGEVGTIFSDVPAEVGEYRATFKFSSNRDGSIGLKITALDDN